MYNFIFIIVALLLMLSCGQDNIKQDGEYFYLADLIIYYKDDPTENSARFNSNRGCFIEPNLIICKKGDWWGCGHELCHATFGDYNHERECKF